MRDTELFNIGLTLHPNEKHSAHAHNLLATEINGYKVSMPVDVQGVHAQALTCLCWCGKPGENTFLDLHIQTRRLLKLVKRCDSG